MTLVEYTRATPELLRVIWDKDIRRQEPDRRDQWVLWKKQFMDDNVAGRVRTYLILVDGEPVGQGTLVLDPTCPQIGGDRRLADGETVANLNALRIERQYEGKGYISQLIKMIEADSAKEGLTTLTIGVEEDEERNRAIYCHWGYHNLLLTRIEDGRPVLYYRKSTIIN